MEASAHLTRYVCGGSLFVVHTSLEETLHTETDANVLKTETVANVLDTETDANVFDSETDTNVQNTESDANVLGESRYRKIVEAPLDHSAEKRYRGGGQVTVRSFDTSITGPFVRKEIQRRCRGHGANL